jgi:cation diffusion facilitator family transporter
MHQQELELWQHPHLFHGEKRDVEKRTLLVVIITFLAMAAEIVFGLLANSMALLADGWHMGTHAFALGISLLAYVLARKYALDRRFTFGTWKIEILGAYSSAIVLGLVGMAMAAASLQRFFHPLAIHYNQALLVAVIGLAVNLLSAAILNFKGHGEHHDDPGQAHAHEHWRQDLNLKSAYLHVLADAVTSILAIAALLAAKYFGWNWLDAAAGILGAILILKWAVSLLRETAGILLEREMDSPLVAAVRAKMEMDGDTKVSDIHLWKVAQDKYACIVSLVTARDCPLSEYKERLQDISEIVHLTIEMNPCEPGHARDGSRPERGSPDF